MRCVAVADFLIDAEPVSTTAFARFLNSVGPLDPQTLQTWCVLSAADRRHAHFQLRPSTDGWSVVAGAEQQPMVLVSWFGANAYSLWAHRRDWRRYRDPTESCLPTDAQWELAAEGASGGHLAIHQRGQRYRNGLLPLAAVNAPLGMSRYGLHHMVGNVWQWCNGWYRPALRSERGGSWVGGPQLARLTYRRGRPPLARGRCLGFRCAMSRRAGACPPPQRLAFAAGDKPPPYGTSRP